MKESAWRKPAMGTWPAWRDECQIPFVETLERVKAYVVTTEVASTWVALVPDTTPATGMSARERSPSLTVNGLHEPHLPHR